MAGLSGNESDLCVPDSDRLLGARDGIVSAMIVIRREIGKQNSRLRCISIKNTRQRSQIEAIVDLLLRLDAELDQRRSESATAWRERQDVEIVSSLRPDFGKSIKIQPAT
jgi:hypothetical protein